MLLSIKRDCGYANRYRYCPLKSVCSREAATHKRHGRRTGREMNPENATPPMTRGQDVYLP